MSFDLIFCQKNERTLSTKAVRDFFAALPYFTLNGAEEDFQAWYENERTGVYCSFDFSLMDQSEPADGVDLPSDFANTGLTFNLNYNRPDFFALESMPLTDQVAKAFDLWTLDPQRDESPPQKWTTAELIASWEQHNEWAVRALHSEKADEPPYLYYPNAKAKYWWDFMRGREELQKTLGDSVFVPTILLIARTETSAVQSAVLWTNALPQVFPSCDFVLRQIVEETEGVSGESKVLEILPYAGVASVASSLSLPCPGPVPDLQVLPFAKCSEIEDIFYGLSGPPFHGYRFIRSDEFVSVPLSS